MPKEQIRKRGKRKAKNAEEDFVPPQKEVQEQHVEQEEAVAGPSGIHPARAALLAGRHVPASELPAPEPVEDEQVLEWARGSRVDSDIPFGMLDPDIKAYFRTVDDQIKDWEGVASVGEEREDRQMFLTSVLGELRGQELTVATDPDTAVVLERLLPSLGDWGRRVIGDAFGDSWETLIRHRFGSHVVQTWLTLAADTLDRETRGIYPPQQKEQEQSNDSGVLPTMTELFTKILELLRPTIPSLLTNPHASPPLRLLLLILTPSRPLPALAGNDSKIRSKRSEKYRKGQAVQGKSIFGDDEKTTKRTVPEALVTLRREIINTLNISNVEWRSMGLHSVGSAAVQLLLEIEADDKDATPLLDIFTSEDYPSTLLTSSTGTRVLETIFTVAPQETFDRLWSEYLVGKIGKYAGHPYANFTVAKGVSRLDTEGVDNVVKECKAVTGGRGLIKTARTSVLLALVERATTLTTTQKSVLSLITSALDLSDNKQIVPCLMALKTQPMYDSLKSGKPLEEEVEVPEEAVDETAEEQAAAAARLAGWRSRRDPKTGTLSPNMQGCLLLQAMVKMPENTMVLDSLVGLPVETLLEYASSPIASHLLDAVLTTPAVGNKHKRKLLQAFLGHYRQLAEDRMGSRVADTIWAKADGFMKEKIASSLIPDANALASSQYGRFLYGKLDLHLLERRPDEWRAKQIGVTRGRAREVPAPAPAAPVEAPVRKRDELDELFDATIKSQAKKQRK